MVTCFARRAVSELWSVAGVRNLLGDADAMSLIPCRDCKTMIPRDAKGCPVCGRNLLSERALGSLLRVGAVVALALVVFGVLLIWLFARPAI